MRRPPLRRFFSIDGQPAAPRFYLAVLLSLIVSVPTAAFAQGNEATTTASPQPEQGAAVEAGAGTLGDVTTGASGPGKSGNGEEPPQPLSVEMPLPPIDPGPLARPGMLPIALERASRCDIIEDETARQRCERPVYRELNPG